MPNFFLSSEAKEDLNDIWLDIFELSKNVEFADAFVESFSEAFSKIAETRGIGESRDYLAPGSGLRKWTHRKYIIYYRPEGYDVVIVRVKWGRRLQF